MKKNFKIILAAMLFFSAGIYANPKQDITNGTILHCFCWSFKTIEENIPKIAEPETVDSYSGQFKLRLPKTLHKTLAEDSKKEGVSMNQYCVYLLAKNSEKEHVALAKSKL